MNINIVKAHLGGYLNVIEITKISVSSITMREPIIHPKIFVCSSSHHIWSNCGWVRSLEVSMLSTERLRSATFWSCGHICTGRLRENRSLFETMKGQTTTNHQQPRLFPRSKELGRFWLPESGIVYIIIIAHSVILRTMPKQKGHWRPELRSTKRQWQGLTKTQKLQAMSMFRAIKASFTFWRLA